MQPWAACTECGRPDSSPSLVFEDAGELGLKGVPDRWHLYRAVSG